MEKQAEDYAVPEGKRIRIPNTSHSGIVEHFRRVVGVFKVANAIRAQDPKGEFRLLMSSVYSCRAIVELMLEQAHQGNLAIGRDELKLRLIKMIPFFNLIERIRIHDFHRYGLTPPVPNEDRTTCLGPITLTARNGVAAFQQTPCGPLITCTGSSSVKERRPLYSVNGTFYDQDTGAYVTLLKIIEDYIVAIPDAVDEYEKLLKEPGLRPSPPFWGDVG